MTHTTTAFRVTFKNHHTDVERFRYNGQKNFGTPGMGVQPTCPPIYPTGNQPQYPTLYNQYPRGNGFMYPQGSEPFMGLSKFSHLTQAISNRYNTTYRLVVEGANRDEIVRELAIDILSFDRGTHVFNNIVTDAFINLSYLSYKGNETPIVYFSVHSSYREAFMATVKLLDKARASDVFTLHHVDRIFEVPSTERIGPSTLTRFIDSFREEAIVIVSATEDIEACLDQKLITAVNLEEVEVNAFFTEALTEPGYFQTEIDPVACSVDDLIDELVTMGYDSEEEIDEDRVMWIRSLINLKINPRELSRVLFMSTYEEKSDTYSSLGDVFPKKQ